MSFTDGDVHEICNGEDFQPRCSGDDVIVMLSARYGRMKIGRCVKDEPALVSIMQDPRYLGCFTDVLRVVSSQCSGKSECTMRVNDQNFDNVTPCYDSLKMYLEVTYICIDGRPYNVCLICRPLYMSKMIRRCTDKWQKIELENSSVNPPTANDAGL